MSPATRGRRGPQQIAPDAWWCEGQWQPDGQLDIWQGLDEVVLDERRKQGLEDDEDDEDDED